MADAGVSLHMLDVTQLSSRCFLHSVLVKLCFPSLLQMISVSSAVILVTRSMTTYWPEPSADTRLSSKLRFVH